MNPVKIFKTPPYVTPWWMRLILWFRPTYRSIDYEHGMKTTLLAKTFRGGLYITKVTHEKGETK